MDLAPQNHWYVVALASEIGSTPLARTVLDNHVVVYRLRSGEPVALSDRCPHRRYPLSLGKVVDDVLVCNYHGFSFDCSGACVAVPGQRQIPAHSDVRRYPLVEQGLWVWIWMGDEDPRGQRPPETPWIEDSPEWTPITGMAPIDCRYELLLDNLLDLSHETYLHGGYIGTPEVAATPISTKVDIDAGIVSVSRHMSEVECPAFYAGATGLSTPIDRWQDIEFFAPGFYLLHVRIAPASAAPNADGGDPEGRHVKVLYGLTPSTSSRTYDFWAVCRDFALDDESISAHLEKMQIEIVQQDVDALNVLERRVAEDPNPFEVILQIDRGALSARRVVNRLSANERAQ